MGGITFEKGEFRIIVVLPSGLIPDFKHFLNLQC